MRRAGSEERIEEEIEDIDRESRKKGDERREIRKDREERGT